MPEISVIVPVYNAEKYLDRCVKSILGQTFSDIELILVDDGSPDKSGELCDRWAKEDNRVRVIHQENAGAGAARNAGLAIARGHYINFVDSDDWIAPQMYEILYKLIRRTSAPIAMTGMISKTHYEEPVSLDITEVQYTIKDTKGMLKRFFRVNGEDSSIISTCGRLIDKKILQNFRFIEGTISEDVSAAFFMCVHSPKTIVIHEPMYIYFQNNSGVTKSKVTKRDFEYIKAFQRIYKFIKENIPEFSYYAEMNVLRSQFTILSKMKLYGYDKNDTEVKNSYSSLKKIVRSNLFKLMKWKMPVSRKILLLWDCFL
ncbi:glycosyltransferase family 2 protein [Mitsuokella sp. WILCCON 0060]|uniref:glycosyltransferase family 2 protein n=1 Tax=Mitsuokella sp. WILCCON 0060 TaxID=3345341 RepID=UPI003F1A1B17